MPTHNASQLLISEPPLQVLPTLATLIGLQRAIFLQQLHYWLDKPSAHEKDGRRWVYNTYEQWQAQLPFWTVRTIKRLVAELVESGLILKENFNTDRRDRTLWYTIDYKVLDALYDEGFSKVRYGTMDSDILTPSTSGQDVTVHSDNLTLSARNMEARARLTETSYRDYTEREERAREENRVEREDEQPQSKHSGGPTLEEYDPGEQTLAPGDAIPVDILDRDDDPLVTTEDCALHYDPSFPCNHVVPALTVLQSVLGRKPHPHRHLHAFVHRHDLGEVLQVAQHFVTHERDKTKWTVGLMFAPDNAEARLQAAQAPAEPDRPRDPNDLSRYDKPRSYDKPLPEPPPDEERLSPEELKGLMAQLHQSFNARGME